MAVGVAVVALGVLVHAAPRQSLIVSLFDGETLGGWTVENSDGANFSVANGVLRVEGPQGWLRSAAAYGDFTLQVEFRFLTDDADSGVFVRAASPPSEIFIRGWPANSYQVQIRNMATNRTTQPLWIGNLYRHRIAPGETRYDSDAAARAFRPTGAWQTAEIAVAGPRLTVVLNGIATTEADDLVNARGHIGIQGETGVVEYRRIAIAER